MRIENPFGSFPNAKLGILLAAFLWGPVCCAGNLGFEVTTTSGQAVAVSEGRYTVVCFLGTECPMARSYAAPLSRLWSQLRSQGVQFVGVMSNVQDSVEDVRQYKEEFKVDFPLVHDPDGRLAVLYGAERTPEVFVLDKSLSVRYHGRIDDRFAPGVARAKASREDLKIAIEELLAGRPVAVANTKALGCIIGRRKESSQPSSNTNLVTYCSEISRVLARNCVECHRTGEIGPFAMDDYDEIVGWADTMLETVEDKRMPPWHADPEYGEFSNARVMSEHDKQLLRDWVAQGMPKGDIADLPPPTVYTEGWQLPKSPDAVYSMRSRPFGVPADGVVEYQYFVVDPKFDEDQWIKAAQIVPGNRSVVHHAIVFIRPPDGGDFRGIGWLSAYVPGQRLSMLQDGFARKVPAGSKFIFQMHYTPTGREQKDTSVLGVVFADEAQVTDEVYTIAAIDQEFEIAPGDPASKVEANVRRLPENAKLLAATPHMHFRGKSFQLRAGVNSENTLLNVSNYDFNWQHTYQFEEAINLDEVSSLGFVATFDNSDNNPFNPDPTQWVTWGDQSWEEMAVAFFEVAVPVVRDSIVGSAKSNVADTAQRDADREARIERYIKKVFDSLDTDADGKIQESEISIVVRRSGFGRWDLDGDSIATAAEVRSMAERFIR